MCKTERVIIGALVGMGPNSTSIFYDGVMSCARQMYGATFDMDFPEIIMISLPTPFEPGKEIDHEKMQEILLDGIRRLNQFGAHYIVIPCNLVHRYYEELQKASKVPILNIIDISVAKSSSDISDKVALIATEGTVNSGLYQEKLTQYGFDSFHTEELQRKVNLLLMELKVHAYNEQAKTYWKDITQYLNDHDCGQAIIACTDLSICLKDLTTSCSVHFIDSSEALAEMTIQRYIELGNILDVRKKAEETNSKAHKA